MTTRHWLMLGFALNAALAFACAAANWDHQKQIDRLAGEIRELRGQRR